MLDARASKGHKLISIYNLSAIFMLFGYLFVLKCASNIRYFYSRSEHAINGAINGTTLPNGL